MDSSCNDLSFSLDNTTFFDYWVESGCNTAHTIIWLDISSFDTGTHIIQLNHGSDHYEELDQHRRTFQGNVILMYTLSDCPHGFERKNGAGYFVKGSGNGVTPGQYSLASSHTHSIEVTMTGTTGTTRIVSEIDEKTAEEKPNCVLSNHLHSVSTQGVYGTMVELPYYDVVFCGPNEHDQVEWGQEHIIFPSDDAGLDGSYFTPIADTHERFIRGSSLGLGAGEQGGSENHEHSWIVVFNDPTTNLGICANVTGNYTDICDVEHLHRVIATTGSLSSVSHLPSSYDVFFYEIVNPQPSVSLPPNGMFLSTGTSTPPLGYTDITTTIDGAYLRGTIIESGIGRTARSPQSHTVDGGTLLNRRMDPIPSGLWEKTNSSIEVSSIDHSHPLSYIVGTTTTEHEPSFVGVKVFKRKSSPDFSYDIDYDHTEHVYWECFDIGMDESSVCNSEGECVDEEVCSCFEGNFYGTNCQEEILNGEYDSSSRIEIPYRTEVNVLWDSEYDMGGVFNCSFMIEEDLHDSECVWETQSLVRTSKLIIRNVRSDAIESLTLNPITKRDISVVRSIEIITTSSAVHWAAVVFPLFFASVIPVCIICIVCPLFLLILATLSFIVFIRQVKLRKFSKIEDVDLILKLQEEENDHSKARLKINEKMFFVSFDELSIVEQLSEGGSASQIFKCVWKSNDCVFKCWKSNEIDQEQLDFFEREVEILASVSHPNILRFFGAVISDSRFGILMEYCVNGDLKKFLKNFPKRNRGAHVEMKDKIRILIETSSALCFLHKRKIIHRDVKCENIMLNKNLESKLGDYGASKVTQQLLDLHTKKIGTSFYMSPEMVVGKEYDEKCDVFSFSIVMWEVVTNDFQPYGPNAVNIEFKVANNPNFRPQLSQIYELKWIKSLIKQCWSHHPQNRPSMEEIRDVLEKEGENIKPSVPVKKTYKNRSNQQQIEKMRKENEEIKKEIATMRKEYIKWKSSFEKNQKAIAEARKEEKNEKVE